MGCTIPSKKSIYHLYIRPMNRYIAYISSKHRCIPLNIIYTSLLKSPYQELFKNIAFHANPGKRTLLKGGGGGPLSRMISGPGRPCAPFLLCASIRNAYPYMRINPHQIVKKYLHFRPIFTHFLIDC